MNLLKVSFSLLLLVFALLRGTTKNQSRIEFSLMPNSPDQQKWRDEKAWWKKQLIIATRLNRITLFSSLVAAAGLVVRYCTLKVTEEAATAAKKQAIAARKAVEIADASFQETAKSFRLDQRAWVGMKSTR
jgi:hypothetical protein